MFETCPVRISEDQIIIYSPDCREIARHRLAEKGRKDRYIGKRHKDEKHILPVKDVAERLEAFGPFMQEFTEALKKHRPRHYMDHWRRILSLKAVYRVEDIQVAVRRALKYRVYEAQAIENFLQVNAHKRSEILPPPKSCDNE
jgi:hypothetical protein